MFNTRSRNILISRKKAERTAPDETTVRLAEYYAKAFAGTLEHMHLSREQREEAMDAVKREYDELLCARSLYGMVS